MRQVKYIPFVLGKGATTLHLQCLLFLECMKMARVNVNISPHTISAPSLFAALIVSSNSLQDL